MHQYISVCVDGGPSGVSRVLVYQVHKDIYVHHVQFVHLCYYVHFVLPEVSTRV